MPAEVSPLAATPVGARVGRGAAVGSADVGAAPPRRYVPPVDPTDIAARLHAVRGAIDAAARRSGRDPANIRLVAVSKLQPAQAIAAAYAAGQRDFGENYVQELVAKAAALAHLDGLRWHLIGALQRNKVKDAVKVAHVIHTVDRVELADELARRAGGIGRDVEALVEVNVAREGQKAGCDPAQLPALLAAIAGRPRVHVVGLMTIPPASADPEASRPHFRALRASRDALRDATGDAPLRELSMGMSSDFGVAIEEGATMVRVGTAIFGDRPPRG
jgi:pyridoxal phosphate enzyme (YggS family)